MGEAIFKKLFPFFVLQIRRNFASGIKKHAHKSRFPQ